MSPASRRLFFALWPSPEQQGAIADAARDFVHGSGARVVPDTNLHVTLAFLGSVPEAKVGELAAIAHRVAASGAARPPLRISFDRVEYWKKAQVLCAVPSRLAPEVLARNAGRDCAGAPMLVSDGAARDVASARDAASLAAALKLDLVAAGFAPDLKPFRAHVTLARKVPRRSDWKLSLRPVSWRFTGFSLIESRTAASGALYSVVDSWLLARRHNE